MKKFVITLCAIGFSLFASAQKFAYVDTEYILNKMPEFRSAQKQLDAMAESWEQEIGLKKDSIQRLKDVYNAEKVLLSEEVKKARVDEIEKKEKELKDYQKEKFGTEGELFAKRKELIKPIQDKVFDAIQKVAKDNALDFIFDKASVTMLFSNAKYDKSADVLDEMGIDINSGGGVTPNEE